VQTIHHASVQQQAFYTEWCGLDLEQWHSLLADQNPLMNSVPGLLLLIRQILHACFEFHDLGLVHNDLHWANIVLNYQYDPATHQVTLLPDQIRLIDFEFALHPPQNQSRPGNGVWLAVRPPEPAPSYSRASAPAHAIASSVPAHTSAPASTPTPPETVVLSGQVQGRLQNGNVIDLINASATVFDNGKEISTQTNANGHFSLPLRTDLPNRPIFIKKPGFTAQEIDFVFDGKNYLPVVLEAQ
jgi:serine/threonine protein kinase